MWGGRNIFQKWRAKMLGNNQRHDTEAIRTQKKKPVWLSTRGFMKTQRRGGQFLMGILKNHARQRKKGEGKRQHEKLLQVQQEAKPQNSAADRQQRLRIATLAGPTPTRLRFDSIEIWQNKCVWSRQGHNRRQAVIDPPRRCPWCWSGTTNNRNILFFLSHEFFAHRRTTEFLMFQTVATNSVAAGFLSSDLDC